MKTLTKKELDQVRCSDPNCTHEDHMFYLHGHCHPHGAALVRYTTYSGVLEVICAECSRPICRIVVADLNDE